ncbi:uncharacterized protein LOC131994902 [Stomoxys calcitrans]|uniref:uncharacterized protein LOC131994902 n=1 Tax=Stomoxys calcitrans TaxID=35570 RepID=UPI0027E25F01|nr:uncharacterized protein LOC131994902 [Stomoxys calcitrans]
MPLTDDEVESGEKLNVGENSFKKIEDKATKIGYADGVAGGRDSVFQKGFDLGYMDGLKTGFEVEKIRNFFKTLNLDKLSEGHNINGLKSEKDQFEKLQVEESKSQNHFQYLHRKEEDLKIVSQRQHEYVNKMMDQFALKIPITFALLNAQESTN